MIVGFLIYPVIYSRIAFTYVTLKCEVIFDERCNVVITTGKLWRLSLALRGVMGISGLTLLANKRSTDTTRATLVCV